MTSENTTDTNPVNTKSRIRTIFEGIFESSKTKNLYSSLPSISQIRAPTLQAFWDRMRSIDAVDAIRSTHIRNVRSGRDTFNDIFRVNFALNDRKAPLIAGGVHGLLATVPEAERESKFPRQQLCEYMGITEDQYKEIDSNGYRRDVFYVFLSLFEDAKSSDTGGNLHTPHMLLIEELVTTLNAGCVCGFPYGEIAEVTKDSIINMNVQEEPNGSRAASYKATVTCTEPNRISVAATLRTSAWLSLGVETHLSYDITLNDDKTISYQNVHTTAAFQGIDRMRSHALFEDHLKNPSSSYSLQQDPPQIYPVRQGLILATPLKGKTFTVASMLSSSPQTVTPPETDISSQPEAQEARESGANTALPTSSQEPDTSSAPEESQRSSEQQANSSTIWERIHNFCIAIFRYIKGLFSSTKVSTSANAAEEVHEKLVTFSDRRTSSAPGISALRHSAAERSAQGPQQQPNQQRTTTDLATGTDGLPGSQVSSVHVRAAAQGSSRSHER
ncbi:hypothetical protein ANPL_03335 [Anaplasma platys]|uniref:Uncharacterized protein n=1 Tax=Anaplasma platys TaxID=949 RepID=A0A858PYQ3_9RICK|nr:hypothetical protein [Anaplasma platys]QJC27725.1 hypothetical protein ANPL_03335 [Anaplasma platys]